MIVEGVYTKKGLKQTVLSLEHLLGELNPCCRDENPVS